MAHAATAPLVWLRNPWIWALLAIGLLAGLLLLWYRRFKRQRMNSPFKYFSWEEFDSADAPGSGKAHMSEDLVRRLDRIREAVGFPLIVSSGYRTPAHNAAVGGVANSAHVAGLAVDLRAITDAQKRAIAKAAIAEGIVRIGWGRTFIHLDIDSSKPQRTAWGYTGSPAPSFSSLA